MMDKQSTTVSSSKVILACLLVITSVLLMITMVLLMLSRSSSTPERIEHSQRIVFSFDDMQRYANFKEFLNVSSTLPPSHTSDSDSNMKLYMRSIYQDIEDASSNIRFQSDDFLIALPNRNHDRLSRSTYQFIYHHSLQSLIDVHLILPTTSLATLRLVSSTFDITLLSPCPTDQSWCEINLTQYVTSFPLTFHLESSSPIASFSSAFLTLHFRPSSSSPSNTDESSLITYPKDPEHCQVRPYRVSFAKLRWSSWIVEPSAYSMNLCSGRCQTASNMATYTILQNLLHQKYPKQIAAPCCRPKRFLPTNFLYYDGENLILKKHQHMRVGECGCSL